jgi:hypothetical protein
MPVVSVDYANGSAGFNGAFKVAEIDSSKDDCPSSQREVRTYRIRPSASMDPSPVFQDNAFSITVP